MPESKSGALDQLGETPIIFGGNEWDRTTVCLRMKEVHDHFATLPYRNTLTFLMSLLTMGQPNVFLYGGTAEIRTRDWQIKSLL